jgi:hypothetical protein
MEFLVEGLKARGMEVLLANDEEELFMKFRRQQEEGITIDTFEPILRSTWLLYERWSKAHSLSPVIGDITQCVGCVLGPDTMKDVMDEVLGEWQALGTDAS